MLLCVQNWSIGSSGYHVLDAISQCEQEERRQGQEEEGAPWHLCFRKELFTPWHDCTSDPISTELIYTQIINDLKSGEYQCDKVRLRMDTPTHWFIYGYDFSETSHEYDHGFGFSPLSLHYELFAFACLRVSHDHVIFKL